MTGIKIITTADLERRLEQGEIVNFWNVLADDYFTGELIPGSRHVPVDIVGREARRLGLDLDAEIVVYCSDLACPNSSTAAQKLADFGYRNVSEYATGLDTWKKAGNGVVEAPTSAAVA